MSAKGYITGNDAADRILRDEVRCAELAVRRVITAERNRLIVEVRRRLGFIPDEASRRAILTVLDEMTAP